VCAGARVSVPETKVLGEESVYRAVREPGIYFASRLEGIANKPPAPDPMLLAMKGAVNFVRANDRKQLMPANIADDILTVTCRFQRFRRVSDTHVESPRTCFCSSGGV
jgi:hypothetical protein